MIRTYDDYGYPFDRVALYDMVDDPYQTRNLVHECPEIADHCSHLLAEWLQEQWTKGAYCDDPLEAILRERGAQ